MPTNIYEIHGSGVPANELPDRGRMVGNVASYIPYTTLTQGEMKLMLLAKQADIYARAFPENREYQQAKAMLNDALHAGVSNGVHFVGALHDPLLQQVAKEISQAARQTRPASRGMLLGRNSLSKGIGAIVLNFDHDCVQYAAKAANAELRQNKPWTYYDNFGTPEREKNLFKKYKAECKVKLDIEKIVNERITNASHHVLYHYVKEEFPAIIGTAVVTKLILQLGGIAGLANATDTNSNLMSVWSETSILQKNTDTGVGPVGSVVSSLGLSPDPDRWTDSYLQWQKKRGISGTRKNDSYIGVVPLIPLIGAITAAVTAAAALLKELNTQKAGAMGSALNYGTPALESKETDFLTKGDSPGSNSMLLLGLAAAGVYLATK